MTPVNFSQVFKDRDQALWAARQNASVGNQIEVLVQRSVDYKWEILPYMDFVPQSEGYESATLRYILPKGECTKLS